MRCKFDNIKKNLEGLYIDSLDACIIKGYSHYGCLFMVQFHAKIMNEDRFYDYNIDGIKCHIINQLKKDRKFNKRFPLLNKWRKKCNKIIYHRITCRLICIGLLVCGMAEYGIYWIVKKAHS